MEYFRNHFLTFLQYDGNLLRRDLIQCSNRTLNPDILGDYNDISSQNHAKENFDEEELPQHIRIKNTNQKKMEHKRLNDGAIQEKVTDGKKETTEDEACYELKRNRDKVYR